MKHKSVKIVAVVLLLSMVLNVVLFLKLKGQPWHIDFSNANSRDTYFTIHSVKQAHNISRGKGIKVGILDHYFGYEEHKDLYKNAIDFLNNSESLNKISEHGYWMATVLREIAPECEIYCFNTLDSSNEDNKVTAMIKAIDWAIENHIDILTYSDAPISERNRQRFDEAVNKAVKYNIVTTFIHYDNPNNLWINGMFSSSDMNSKREPDLNVLHYDYNSLRMNNYEKYLKLKNNISGGDNIPYFSLSSTSPVAAGFLAILKGVNNKLAPNDYKDILIKTSYKMTFKDPFTFKEAECPYVVDMEEAVNYIKEYNN